jgi:hypothetical protein
LVGQQAAGLLGRYDHQFDLPPRRFLMHVRHHRQPAVPARADDQPPAAPGQVFPERQRSVTIRRAVGFGRFLDPLADFTAVDDDVVVLPPAVDLDRAERDALGLHGRFSSLEGWMTGIAIRTRSPAPTPRGIQDRFDRRPGRLSGGQRPGVRGR